MSEPRPWHRLFGVSLVDFFRGAPVLVELEKDLSLKQQLLDVVLIRKGAGLLSRRLPDGFEELAAHNLVSFKSYQEALDGWALNELVGHYVNYRKQASPSMQELLPETDFRLFAVSVRFPQVLARQTTLTPVRPGVYDVRQFTGTIRVVVVHELPQEEHNALLHLFSARTDLVRYGAAHYRPRSEETSTLLLQLFQRYRLEVAIMPDPLQELARETIDELLKELPVKERIKGLSVDDLLAALSPETRAALAQRLRENGAAPKPGGA
ncbi:MAG TPA: hypothetical protein VMS17_01165 [Gemmataceae bacterium]|nr:hypothetical protein [Gemmataceae bacterium]